MLAMCNVDVGKKNLKKGENESNPLRKYESSVLAMLEGDTNYKKTVFGTQT